MPTMWGHGLVLAGTLTGPPPAAVAGGVEVAACGWPTVVRMQGNCSGTLVHPQVVLYASHCGTGSAQVLVGEDEATATPHATDACTLHPLATGEPGGTDIAMCTLVDPVDVPIVPILMGCEAQWLQVGSMVTSVGFGNAPDGPNGVKRAVTYPVTGIFDETNVINAGAEGQTLCSGDSGGGSFVQMFDGTWRAFGISSAVQGTPCVSGDSVLAGMAAAVPWIEQTTGFDVTPCHDADGNWQPGPECTGFPEDPATGGGMWPACETGPLAGPSSTCGAPSTGPDDLAAPTVTIVDPVDGAAFPLDIVLELAEVAVTFDVDDGDGWGIAYTRLRIDSMDVAGSDDDFPPYEVPTLQFSEGVYTIEVVAVDWAGNEAMSEPVVITVGDPPASDTGGSTGAADDTSGEDDSGGAAASTGGESTGGGDTHGTAGSSTGGEAAASDGGGGCGCTQAPAGSAGWLLLGLLWLGRVRRETCAVS